MFSILNYTLGCNYALLCFSNVEVINQVTWKDVGEITQLLQQTAWLVGEKGRDQANKMTLNYFLKTDHLRKVPDHWISSQEKKNSFSYVHLVGTHWKKGFLQCVQKDLAQLLSDEILKVERRFCEKALRMFWNAITMTLWTQNWMDKQGPQFPQDWESKAPRVQCNLTHFSKRLSGCLALKSALVVNCET